MKTNLYVVTGGIGKQVLFSNLIEDLAKKDGTLISIASVYPTLFVNHPLVYSSIDLWDIDHLNIEHKTLDPKLIDKYFHNIIGFDPFFSNYLKLENHIINSWREGLSLIPTQNTYTDIVVNSDNAKTYNGFLHIEENERFVIVQLRGGTYINNKSRNEKLKEIRDYSDIYQLISAIANRFCDIHFLIVKTSEDVYDERIDKLPNVGYVENIPLLDIQYLVNKCLTFISIDSCIQHFAVNKENLKKGIVLWGNIVGPQINTIGHKYNTNLMSEKINELYIHEDVILEKLENILSQ